MPQRRGVELRFQELRHRRPAVLRLDGADVAHFQERTPEHHVPHRFRPDAEFGGFVDKRFVNDPLVLLRLVVRDNAVQRVNLIAERLVVRLEFADLVQEPVDLIPLFFGIELGMLLNSRGKAGVLLFQFSERRFRRLRPLAVILVVLDRSLKLRLEFGKRGLRLVGYEENFPLRAAIFTFRLHGFGLDRGLNRL